MTQDSFTQVTRQGLGGRISNSIGGMLFGFILGIGSVILLWWNEGNLARERAALHEIESQVVEADPAAPNPSQSGALIHGTARLSSSELLSDSQFLKPGPYLKLKRRVWMFQWVENKSSRTEKSLGGSETRTTTYNYNKEWHEGRVDSSRFNVQAGHENPLLPVEPKEFDVASAQFGALDGIALVRNLNANEDLTLDPETLRNPSQPLQAGKILVRKNQASTTDEIGDARVSFSAARPGEYSAIGVQQGTNRLVPFSASNGKEKLLIASGTVSAAAIVSEARAAAGMFAWILRGAGFLCMWLGLGLLTSPITTLLDIVPFLGSIGRGTIGFFMGLIALVMTIVITLVSYVAHNPIALVVAIAVVIGGGLLWMKRHVSNKAAAAGPAMVPPGSR